MQQIDRRHDFNAESTGTIRQERVLFLFRLCHNNKRPRGLNACQQHCKISATDVSENVYLCSKMHYHKNKICIGR